MTDRPLVLLVEDNPRNLKLARDVLEFAGFTVAIAGTGEDGGALAASALPDLILMDIQLPGIDGYAALEQIRRNSATTHIPVVALTAVAMARDRDRGAVLRLRRIPREADQRARVPDRGAPPSRRGSGASVITPKSSTGRRHPD